MRSFRAVKRQLDVIIQEQQETKIPIIGYIHPHNDNILLVLGYKEGNRKFLFNNLSELNNYIKTIKSSNLIIYDLLEDLI